MNDSDRFFRASASDASRPRAVNPQTGVEQSWQRASNYAAPLDNPHGLITWQLRELVKGLSLRPDLARMLLTGAAIEDNAKADEIIASAHAVAATDAKANEGTAVHAALTRSFLGHEVPQEYLPHVRAFAAELQRNGLTPVATEIRTLCVKLGVIGHTDWVVKTADGRYLILDVKTGKLSDARKFAVQCIAYGAAEYIDDGNNGWSPIPFMIDQTEAILAHIDPETGATSLYRVDLVLGLYGATLAERVRDWAKIEVLSPYVPVHHAVAQKIATAADVPVARVIHAVEQARVHPPQAVAGSPTTAAAAPATPSPATEPAPVHPREQYAHLADVTPEGVLVVNDVRLDTLARDARHPAEVEACRAEIARRAIQPAEQLVAHTVPDEVLRRAVDWCPEFGIEVTWAIDVNGPWSQLMTLEQFRQFAARTLLNPLGPTRVSGPIEVTEPRPASAEVALQAVEQHAVSPVAPSTDPAAIEAERADLMQQKNDKATLQRMAGNMGLKDLAHNRQWLADWIIATRRGAAGEKAVQYAKSKGTMSLSGSVPIGERPSTEAERQAGDLSFIFKSIEGARSEGAIEALRANIVERRGDQAWTDEMAEAARRRVNGMIAASGNAVDPTVRVLARLQGATEPAHVAELWSEVTIGGSAPLNWTPGMKDAADRRLHEIQQAQGAPPANPYE